MDNNKISLTAVCRQKCICSVCQEELAGRSSDKKGTCLVLLLTSGGEISREVGAVRAGSGFCPQVCPGSRMATADHTRIIRKSRCGRGVSISIFIYFTRIWQILKDSHAHAF